VSYPPIEELVPHAGAMVLLEELLEWSAGHARCRLRIREGAPFVRERAVESVVTIEYMAQAVAAWSGARSRAAGGSPRIGYLLGSRRYEAHVSKFETGAELRVHAQCELMGDNGLGMFDCRITQGERVLAAGRLSVFEPPVEQDNNDEGSPGPAGAREEG